MTQELPYQAGEGDLPAVEEAKHWRGSMRAERAAHQMSAETLSMAKNGKSNKNWLRASRVVDVPLQEVSGICSRRSRNGVTSLIVVGDRASKVAWFAPPRDEGDQIDWRTSDIAKISASMLPEHDFPDRGCLR